MKATVFGAGGLVGQWIVKLLLEQGDTVTAVVPSLNVGNFTESDKLTLVEGDVMDFEVALNATKGADVVFSATGASYMNGMRSSSGLGTIRRPLDDLRTAGATNIVTAMDENQVKRIVVVGISGILLQKGSGHMIMDEADYPKHLHRLSTEYFRTYEMFRESDLDWTIVCPSQPLDGEPTKKYQVLAEHFPPGTTPCTGDIAHFMVLEAKEKKFVHNRVGISIQ